MKGSEISEANFGGIHINEAIFLRLLSEQYTLMVMPIYPETNHQVKLPKRLLIFTLCALGQCSVAHQSIRGWNEKCAE